MKKSIVIVFLLCLSAYANASGESKLDQFISEVKSLKANFSQELVSENGVVTKSSDGVLMLSKPGKFRWNYQSPYVQEIVANGEKIWIYDPDLEQVTIKLFTEAMSASPVALLTQQGDIRSSFVVEEINQDDSELDWVSLKPVKAESDFERVNIGLDDIGVKSMVLFDQFGQQTRIQFNHVEINPVIDDQLYEFIPPEGVDVIGGTS